MGNTSRYKRKRIQGAHMDDCRDLVKVTKKIRLGQFPPETRVGILAARDMTSVRDRDKAEKAKRKRQKAARRKNR